MVAVEAGLFFAIEYRFLKELKIFFGVMAVVDTTFFFVYHRPDFVYVQWIIMIAFLLWQSFITGSILFLLCPELPPSIKRIIPAVVAAFTVINGKPGTVWGHEYPTQHMLIYELICLGFLILTLCAGVITCSVRRFEVVAIGFGMLLAAQSAACIHRLYVGFSPFVWNLCWLAGICFIVHAVFTYDPLGTLPPTISSRAGRTGS